MTNPKLHKLKTQPTLAKAGQVPNSVHSQGLVEAHKEEQSLIRLFGSKLHLCRNKRSRHLEDFCDYNFCHIQNPNVKTEKVIALTFSLVAAVCLLAAVHPSLAVVLHLAHWKLKILMCKRKVCGNVFVCKYVSRGLSVRRAQRTKLTLVNQNQKKLD